MTDKLYGGHCHICSHMRHNGEQSREPVEWLTLGNLQCADCSFCQESAFYQLLDDSRELPYSGVRHAMKVFRESKDRTNIHSFLRELKR